jgi:hypothetical protein
MTIAEVVAGSVVGFALSWWLALKLFPELGLPITPAQATTTTMAFAVVGMARAYAMRRLFERIRRRRPRRGHFR